MIVLRDFLQMHATNNHSDIILPLIFLLMVFPSDAVTVSEGGRASITQRNLMQCSERSELLFSCLTVHPPIMHYC